VTRALAGVKACLQNVFRQVAPDEHEMAVSWLARLPGALTVSLDQHVNALNDETIGVVLELDDPLEAQNIGPELLDDILDPRNEFLGEERRVRRQ
jgi:hypothetical protein